MNRFYFVILLLLIVNTELHASVGFHQSVLISPGERTLSVTMWYPIQLESGLKPVGENAAFYGVDVITDAPPGPEKHPLVLLSHGYGGSWRNLSWLAAALVAQGYIVAAPDHPGTTALNKNPAEASRLWLRPHDLTRVLNYLLANATLVGKIDDKRIAATGHSLGGWTVMALAGAKFSPTQFRRECKKTSSVTVCNLQKKLGLNTPDADRHFAAALADPRIKSVIALDAGLVRGFTQASLSHITIPVLLLAAGNNIADLPAHDESGYLAKYLPPSLVKFNIIPDASHFSFMQLCKPNAAQLIDKDAPGEGIICRDATQRSRATLHQEIQHQIIDFLAVSLNYCPIKSQGSLVDKHGGILQDSSQLSVKIRD
ncbi:alpha/beta fold hydrolase [Erwinia pyri]|uniref:Alpha/beta fold hydrolase n=1 Tax=Erwinia pyri TaxID=3062598 RepID=A0AA50DHW7_9GAMM|nr:alpha/beta fold hydrolase [Erwinia sp. DE2]WLS77278.1 alpha/beta fold hydrolase [Erwinia sp. DE2]